MRPGPLARVEHDGNDRIQVPLRGREPLILKTANLGLPQLYHVRQETKTHASIRLGLVFEQHIHPDETASPSERNSIEQVGLLLLQIIRNEGAVDPFRTMEIEFVREVSSNQTQQAAQVFGQFQQPQGSSVGKLTNGRFGLLRHSLRFPFCPCTILSRIHHYSTTAGTSGSRKMLGR